jgi:hypothetical protein
MNRTLNKNQQIPRPRGAAMVGLIAALFCAAPAFADVVNFETLLPATYESGLTLSESGYNMLLIEGPGAAAIGQVSGIGTIADANNPNTCDFIACPSGASGNYLVIQNDGAIQFSHPGALNGFTLTGFDFAFVPQLPVGPGNYGQLQLSGVNWQGTTIMTRLDFPGQDDNGSFLFGSAELDAAFRTSVFSSLTINACVWDGQGECQNSLANPAFNQAQFAIDNLALNAVPEPASFLLIGLGIGALGLSRRRTARQAALSTSL